MDSVRPAVIRISEVVVLNVNPAIVVLSPPVAKSASVERTREKAANLAVGVEVTAKSKRVTV